MTPAPNFHQIWDFLHFYICIVCATLNLKAIHELQINIDYRCLKKKRKKITGDYFFKQIINLCLANSLIYCAHWSSICLPLSLSKIIQTVTLKLTLIQCNLGNYRTACIGVYQFTKDKTLNISGIAWFKPWNSPDDDLQFKSEFKENYLVSSSLNLPWTF